MTDRIAMDRVEGLARALHDAAETNTRWRREECINLIPSEQPVSPFVERLSVADPAARYNEHKRQEPSGDDLCYYKGTSFIMEKEQELKAALCTFFGCARAEVRVAVVRAPEREEGEGERLLAKPRRPAARDEVPRLARREAGREVGGDERVMVERVLDVVSV